MHSGPFPSPRPLLSRLRRARWMHTLQLFVFTCWVANPFPGAFSYWTDTNGDRLKEEVANPPEGDSWFDQDSDGDSLTNAQEALFGSDPYQIDADFDGLTDLIERDYADPTAPFDPWNWDSDADGFSDHDEYYQRLWGWQPQVNYINLAPGGFYSYADADGDGTKNPEDYDFNLDRDGDGTVNWLDGAASYNGVGGMYMDDANNGVWTDPGVYIGGMWYPSGTLDSDMDGTPDHLDVFPYGSFTYNGVEYGGAWQDSDSDGTPDVADMYPDDSSNGMGFTYNGNWYSGSWQDSDGDGVPDVADAWPNDASNGGFWFNNTWYSGSFADQDNDGVPDVADSHPNDSARWSDADNDGRNAADDSHPDYSWLWSDWNFNWSNNDTDGDEDGVPDARDSHPRESWRSSDWNNDGTNDAEGSDADGDGRALENDSHPGNSALWSDWNFNGTNNDANGDEDARDDTDDSHPRDPALWSDWNQNGSNNDSDGDEDGLADAEDSHPRFNGLRSDWNGDGDDNDNDWDEDGIANGSDSHPRDSGVSSDFDGDGRNEGVDSHPQNNALWSDWDGNGVNNDADGDEDGWADGSDSHPRQNNLWNDFDGDNVNADHDSDPQNNQLWSDWNRNGTNNDADWDEDNVPNENDSSPYLAHLWSDWDQNGVNNDTDGDEDGAIDTLDSHPRHPAFWGDWNYDGSNDTPADNADGDARDNTTDSDPLNAALWSDWNHDGDNNDADADEDGHVNGDDSHPFDPALSTDWNGDGDDNEADVDEDGRANEHTAADGSFVSNQDSHPRNSGLWSDWDGNGVNNDEDGDEDGVLDANDSHPQHAHLWSDWNYNQTNNDSDGDEDGTQDSQDSDPRNASLRSDWNHDGDDNAEDWDEDGHDNGSDSHPANAALWDDYDGDSHNAADDSDPADGSLWSDWNDDGDNHATDGDEDGFGDLSDSDPRNADLWIDWNHDGYNDGDEPPDRDGDGIFDNADNWPDDPYNNADTDMDGLTDYDEVFTHGTNREDVDSDDDFLTDYEELLVYHTNPLAQKSNPALPYTDYQAVDQTDSDNDQIPDRVEQWYADQGFGMSPNDANDASGDLDGDGVSNLQAYLNGWSLVLYLDTYDADEDRITDAVEDHWAAVAPGSLNKNVFADAVADFDNDGVMNFEEITLRLNLAAASSGRADGLGDLQVLALSETLTTRVLPGDCDGDGMSDVWEYRHTLDLRDASDAGAATGLLEAAPALLSWEEFVIAFDPSGVSTPTEQNYQEYTDQHAQTVVAHAQTDPDFDLLSNLREFQLGSHPRIADTDGDGWDDASEMQAGSNATLFGSTPLNPGGGSVGQQGGGTAPGGGSTNNNTPPGPPPVITLAGRYNAVGFSATPPQIDERYGTADETDRKASLEAEGFIDVTAGSDASNHVMRNDPDGMPVYADWKLVRERPGSYSYEATGTQHTEPEPIPTDKPIAKMVQEGGQGPEIDGHLVFEPAEPNKSSSADAGGLGAGRGSHTEGLATFQTGSWKEFWLHASAAVPEAVSRTYLIRKTSGSGGTPQITAVTLTIPKNGTHSTQGTNSTASDTNGRDGTLKLHPAQGEIMSLLPVDIDVAKIAHNAAAGELDDSQKESTGAFVPLNSDDDDYSATLTNLGSDKDQSGAITGENDLLPIYLRKLPQLNGAKFLLDIPSTIKIWKNSNRQDEITSTTELDATADTTVYAEGVSKGSGLLKLTLRHGSQDKTDIARLKITVFELKGVLNVPGYTAYSYTSDGSLPTGSKWGTPTGGSVKSGTTPTQAIILWDQGPVVGKAVYEVNSDYIWDLSVNVVQVKFTNGTSNLVKYGKDPVQATSKTYIISADDGQTPAMDAKLTVEKMIGPTVGASTRGEKFIEFGFIQNAAVMSMHGLYLGFDPPRIWKSSLEKDPAELLLDTLTEDPPSTLPWYDSQGNGAHEAQDGIPQTAINLHISDIPSLKATKDITLNVGNEGDDVDRFELDMLFKLYFAVRTVQDVNDSKKVYTQRGFVEWFFNGSGNISNDLRHKWTKDDLGGSSGSEKFIEINDGSLVPKTGGELMNSKLKNHDWSDEAVPNNN